MFGNNNDMNMLKAVSTSAILRQSLVFREPKTRDGQFPSVFKTGSSWFPLYVYTERTVIIESDKSSWRN